MANTFAAPRDGNGATVKLACLNTDTVQGATLVAIAIDAASGGIMIDTISTISFTMVPVDPRDPNYIGVWLFQGTDGKCYPAVANASGGLLIEM